MNSGYLKCPICEHIFLVGSLTQDPTCPECNYHREEEEQPKFVLIDY